MRAIALPLKLLIVFWEALANLLQLCFVLVEKIGFKKDRNAQEKSGAFLIL